MEDNQDTDKYICRICRTNDPTLTLCKPCNCRGTQGQV